MNRTTILQVALTATAVAAIASHARADVIADWNGKAGEIVVESKLGTPQP